MSPSRRIRLFVLAAAVASLPLTAMASSCRLMPISEATAQADAVFSGEAVAVKYRRPQWPRGRLPYPNRPRCGPKVVTIKVDRVWKGDVGPETMVFAGDGCLRLGGYFTKGTRYLVVARKLAKKAPATGRAVFSTNVCMGTARTTEAEKRRALDWLNANAKPARNDGPTQ